MTLFLKCGALPKPKTEVTTSVPRMSCQWYVRGDGEGKRRILIGQYIQRAEESRIFCNFSLWVTLCTNALQCCQPLERFTVQFCDSATWFSTHTCSMLLRSNCENGFFILNFYFSRSRRSISLFPTCTGLNIDSAGVRTKNKLIFTSIEWHFNISYVGCPRNKQKKFSVRTKTNRDSTCFGCFLVCLAKPINYYFRLFQCFGSLSKQPKQTDL
jgi:hypothetical protein